MLNLRVDEQSTSVPDAPAITPSQQDERDIATAGTQTVGRLRALVARGYKPEYDVSDDRCLVLTHPIKNFKYRDMLLDSSGTVWWRYDQDYTTHFSRWEKKRFETFLRHVPQPSSWDRTRPYWERIGAAVLGAIVCYVLYVIVGAAMPFAYGYFGWS
jgi:hypothetical protein